MADVSNRIITYTCANCGLSETGDCFDMLNRDQNEWVALNLPTVSGMSTEYVHKKCEATQRAKRMRAAKARRPSAFSVSNEQKLLWSAFRKMGRAKLKPARLTKAEARVVDLLLITAAMNAHYGKPAAAEPSA